MWFLQILLHLLKLFIWWGIKMLSSPAGNTCQAFHVEINFYLAYCCLCMLFVQFACYTLSECSWILLLTITFPGKYLTVREIISCILANCLFFSDMTGIIPPYMLSFDWMSVTSKHKSCSCGVSVFIQVKQINALALQGQLNYHRQPCWICKFQICIELM